MSELNLNKLIEETVVQARETEAHDRETRYIFYAGDEPGRQEPGGLLTQSPSVPGGWLPRYAVMPVVTTARWSRIEEIPTGQMVPNSQHARPGLAQEWVYAGAEALSLLEQYGNVTDPSRARGLVELPVLRGRDWKDVAGLGLTEFYFSGWPDGAPKTNAEAEAIVAERLKTFSPVDARERVIRDCGVLMLAAIRQADTYQRSIVTQTNIAVTLPATEPGYKRDFDPADHLYSERTGVRLAMNSLRTTNPADEITRLAEAIGKAQTGVNPEMVASIVAATVAALKAEGTAPAPLPLPETNGKKKAA